MVMEFSAWNSIGFLHEGGSQLIMEKEIEQWGTRATKKVEEWETKVTQKPKETKALIEQTYRTGMKWVFCVFVTGPRQKVCF